MTAKTKTKSHENPRHESRSTPEKKQIDNKLDRELADSATRFQTGRSRTQSFEEQITRRRFCLAAK
jgi:hypothetical protein